MQAAMNPSNLEVVSVNLNSLNPDPENPRTHDERNLASIRASLEAHGQVEPLVVQRSSMMIIAGNGRAEAMREIGWESASVALIDCDDEAARRLSIALNRSGELAGWDEGILAQHLKELSMIDDTFDPVALGFTGSEMEALVAEFADDIELLGMEPPDGEVSGGTGLPPGTQPEDMPTSAVRMVQLFLDDQTAPQFQMWVRKLAKRFDTDNITDTVFEAVRSVAEDGDE
jgi:hypothetical protein